MEVNNDVVMGHFMVTRRSQVIVNKVLDLKEGIYHKIGKRT